MRTALHRPHSHPGVLRHGVAGFGRPSARRHGTVRLHRRQHDGAQISIFGVELIPKPGRMEGTGFVTTLTLDHQITPHLGLELDGGYTPRLGEPHEAAVTTATAGLVYLVNPAHDDVLYLTVGGGAAWFHAADKGIDNDVTGTGMAGIGVKVYYTPRIVLRIDYRWFYAPSPFTDQDLLQRATIGIGARF